MELNKTFSNKNPAIRIMNAFKYSLKGLNIAFKTEQAFRQNVLIFLINTIITFYFCSNKIEIMWFLFCGIFLLIAELINTAIEYIVDRIGKEYNPISGYAKDMGSAIVLLSLVNLLVSWLVFKFY